MNNEIYTITGSLLKRARKNNNLTLEEVANKFGKSKSWIGDIESGRNRIYFDDAIKLCSLYKIDIDELSKSIDNIMNDKNDLIL